MNMNEETYDCGCINHGDDEAVQCESCGYISCLDCHHINSQSMNVKEWKCYEEYGCNKGRSNSPTQGSSQSTTIWFQTLSNETL